MRSPIFICRRRINILNKGKYGHPGGFIHAGIHIALTPLVYLVLLPGSLLLAAGLALGEFVLHYHIDWLKEQITHRNGWTTARPAASGMRSAPISWCTA